MIGKQRYLPQKLYDILPIIWLFASVLCFVVGNFAIVSSLLFMSSSVLVFHLRDKNTMALLSLIVYVFAVLTLKATHYI